MRRPVLAAAVVLSAGAAVVATLPASAVPGYGTALLPTATEAWYWTAGCSSSVGCGMVAPPSDPYPAHTLHVGEDAGQPLEASYLTLDTSGVPAGSIVTAATLVLPVATDSPDRAFGVASAQIVACPTTESFRDAEFATSPPPASDCQVEAHASYRSGSSEPLFTIDLAPLVEASHGSLRGLGVALLPDASQPGTWQVPFNGRRRNVAGQRPITAQVTYRPSSVPQVTHVSVVPVSGSGPTPAAGGSFTAPTAAVAPPPPGATGPAPPPTPFHPPPQISSSTAPSPVPPAAAATTGALIRGGRYGLYWAVPIGLMLLAWLVVSTGGGDIRSYARRVPLTKRVS